MDEKQAHQEEETVGRTVTQAASGTNVVVYWDKHCNMMNEYGDGLFSL